MTPKRPEKQFLQASQAYADSRQPPRKPWGRPPQRPFIRAPWLSCFWIPDPRKLHRVICIGCF